MEAASLACAVAGHGLADHDGRYPSEPLDEDAWRHLRAAVIGERLPPLMAAAVDDGAFPVTEKQWSQVEADQKTAMKAAVDLDRQLLTTMGELSSAGVETRALKGASSAYLAYSDPSLRAYGDVDVLVRPGQLAQAVAVLEASGGARRYPEPRPGFDREFSKGACVVTTMGREVDLHRSLAAGPFGQLIDLDELFAGTADLRLGGVEVLALSADRRLVHAAYHAVLGGAEPRLGALRDVAQLALLGEGTGERAVDLARSWRGEAVLALALREAWRMLQPDRQVAMVDWAEAYKPSRSDARRLGTYVGSTRSSVRQAVETLIVVRGIGPRWRYLRALAVPDASDRSPRSRWRGVLVR